MNGRDLVDAWKKLERQVPSVCRGEAAVTFLHIHPDDPLLSMNDGRFAHQFAARYRLPELCIRSFTYRGEQLVGGVLRVSGK